MENYYEVMSPEARELVLYAENDEQLYRQEQAIVENLDRKMQRGTYDRAKAPKLWRYLYDAAAKKYGKEFGGRWNTDFPTKARNEASAYSAEGYERDYADRLARGEVKLLKSKARHSR